MQVRGLLLLSALLPASLSAQTISVVATQSLRPTAVLVPHVRYLVAVDSETGQVALRDLAIPPVVFGTIRVEGVQPGQRESPAAPFADTVRFEPDGRVVLLRADERGRAPISVEVVGARGAAGGRIVISAPQFPLNRVLLVTVAPADIYEMGWGSVGFAVRDHIRVDDRAGMAYLTDSTTGATTVAIGLGRGAAGRVQSQATDIVLRRDFGGEEGRERRQIGALSLAIEPARDDAGNAHAEVVFGLGESEGEAARAAQAAGAEANQPPRAANLRVRTPDDEVDAALHQALAAAGWQLDWDLLGGARTITGIAMRPAVRAADAWRAAPVARARGDTAAVCGSYRLLRGGLPPSAPPHGEVALRLGARGRYLQLGATDSAGRGADAGTVLLAYDCYRGARDAAWLRAEVPALAEASSRAASDVADPSVLPMLRRMGEIEDELARLSGGRRESHGDSLRALATQIEGTHSYTTPAEAWRAVRAEAHRTLTQNFGRPAFPSDPGGLSLTAAGTFVDAVVRGVFGIEEHLDRVDVMPNFEGVADDQTWELSGWILAAGDTLDVSYRPVDQAARVRIAAARGWRLALRFPWLTENSCVTARRGPESERLSLVMMSDGAGYVDVRATFDPAEIRVTAQQCA
ncbi:MAG: hypothetical protein ACHQU8_07390 [Gemmatimonadales bacterium]